MKTLYECERCNKEVYFPVILSVAICEPDRKGIKMECKLRQYNVCLDCAKKVLDFMGDKDEIQD